MIRYIWYIGVILALQGCATSERLQQRAAEQVTEFLDKYQQKWSLEVLSKEADARFTVVHIRQQHYSDILTKRTELKFKSERDPVKIARIKNDYLSQLYEINNIQNNIVEFLTEVAGSRDFLYVEGRSFPQPYRDKFLEDYIRDSTAEVSKILNFNGPLKSKIPDPPVFLGASIPLHQSEHMNVIGVENLGLLNLTLSLYENDKLSKADLADFLRECHEVREDQIIKNMAENFDELPFRMNSIRFLICGSKHDFRDNLKKWNKENPERKFNLIIYTPAGLR